MMDPQFFLRGLGIGFAIVAPALVVGVFIGSALWWLLLSGGVALYRHRFDTARMRWVNRFSGVLITAFGLWALVSLWRTA